MKPAHKLFVKMFIGILACSLCCVLLLVSVAALTISPQTVKRGSTLGLISGIAVFVFAITVVLSFMFSKWIYTPIQNIIAEKSELESQTWRYGKIIEQQFLLQLTTQPTSNEIFVQKCSQYELPLRTSLQLCLMQLRSVDDLLCSNQAAERALLYAIHNIAQEVLKPYADSAAVSMQDKHGVLLFVSGHNAPVEQDAFQLVCSTVHSALNVPVFAAYTLTPCAASQLTAAFSSLSLVALSRILPTTPECLCADTLQSALLLPNELLNKTEQLMKQCIDIGHRLITCATCESAEEYIELLRSHESHIQLYCAAYDAVCASWTHELLVLKSVSNKKSIEQYSLPSLALEKCSHTVQVEQFVQRVCYELNTLAQELQQPQSLVYLGQVHDLVEMRYADPSFGVQELADSIGLSAPYLSKLYKNATGNNITGLLAQRRMDEAQQLLCDTTLPIAQIATRCGYLNANYFHRVFKNTFLITPQQYRAKGTKRGEP